MNTNRLPQFFTVLTDFAQHHNAAPAQRSFIRLYLTHVAAFWSSYILARISKSDVNCSVYSELLLPGISESVLENTILFDY